MRTLRYCLGSLLLHLVAAQVVTVAADPAKPAAKAPGMSRVGFVVDVSEASALANVADRGAAPIAFLRLDWEQIERDPGVYDWSLHDPAIDALRGAGFALVLSIGGTHREYLPSGGPPSPSTEESLPAWVAFVRAVCERYGDRVEIFQVGWRIGRLDDPDAVTEALVIKQASLAVRAEAEARGRAFRVVQPAVASDELERQRELWANDLSAYVDIVPVLLRPGGISSLRGIVSESLRHPPATEIWSVASGPRTESDPGLSAEALAAGASVAIIRPGDRAPVFQRQTAWGATLDRLLTAGFAPAPQGALTLECGEGKILARFFKEDGFESLVVYDASSEPASGTCRMHVAAAVVRDARLLDPASGEEQRIHTTSDGGTGRTLSLTPGPAPGLVFFRQSAAGSDRTLPPEALAIASSRGLTAEEIIARHQAVQREQENRLDRFTAKGRVDYHFQLTEGGSTIDVSIDSQYFWERGGDLEWEQLDYYLNGNRIRWKKFPRIPLIQPEKVITLPLDLTLNRTYAYRLVGEGVVDGSEAYEIEFQPVDRGAALSLYRGRIWIDKKRFVRLKLRLIQSNLEPPVISNEEIDHFSETLGPEGGRFWLFSRIDGQQVWNVAGRAFVVRRELTFREVRINPPLDEFEARRDQAYDSKNTMMRDTTDGFRYLHRTGEGDRVVKEKVESSTLFLGAGAFQDASQDNVVPLAAVNYFDYDVAGKNLQLNVFFAGAFAFANLSKPGLFGGKMDLTVDLGLSAINFGDRFYVGEDELIEERLDQRPQRLGLRLGFPLGGFVKLTAIGAANYWQYGLSDTASEAIASFNADPGNPEELEFLVPEDHLELSATLEARFNRRGYTVVARAALYDRSDWEIWGLQDTGSGAFGSVDPQGGGFVPIEPEPAYDRYTRWGLTAFKEWFLPGFQKVRAEVSHLDGEDLDRFSRYQFSYFGADRLNGFSGSGVRFDQGWIGRAGYSFNLAEVIQLDVNFDTARVEELRTPVGGQNFTGFGVNANFPAPWRTVINLGYGRALASDIPELKGNQEFLLLVLKLF
jgi:hypothetical protein